MSDVCVCVIAHVCVCVILRARAHALSDVWVGVYRADPKERLRGVYTKL